MNIIQMIIALLEMGIKVAQVILQAFRQLAQVGGGAACPV